MKVNKIVPVLETKRLILRGILLEDTDNIVKWRSNPDVYPYFLSPHEISKEEHITWFNQIYLSDINRFDWICLKKNTNESIGIFGVKKSSENAKEAEISYLISPNAQNSGFGREAVTEIIRWCKFNGVIQINAVIHEKNQKSIKFIKNMGFSSVMKKGQFITYRKD